jgi:two-component system, response regulator PdtaR
MSMNTPIRVVMAEDDSLVSAGIRRLLEAGGFDLIGEAANGEEAVAMVCDLRPDVVLMDIEMPRMNGLDATRLIQERSPTPVVVLTAHESKETVEAASEAGVAGYLMKPPSPNEIDRAITVAMARHGDLVELRALNEELERQRRDLKKALAEVKTLRGILPICSGCKKIRDDQGYWKQVDVYLTNHTEADFSHSVCPDCIRELYPDLGTD